jgi:uncharacterized membrane protein (UPF0127 family)
MRVFRIFFLISASFLGTGAFAQMPLAELYAGMHRIEAEVASDFRSRATGLMHREELGSNQGMIFVFPALAPHCMWMRNTLIPLAVAFLDEEGTILNVEEMAPRSDENHCARGPARFALEMNAGWFALRRIAPGMKIRGVDTLPHGE